MSNGARRSFRPSLWPSVFTGFALVILVLLGNWQMDRLVWKRALLQKMAVQMALPPTPLPDVVQAPEEWSYRRVTVTGIFDHAHEVYLFGPGPKGGTGYQVITPLRRESGPVVLVNRGWVPTSHKDPATRVAGQTQDQVTVTGIIRLSGKANRFSPAPQPEQNIWYVRDIAAIARHLALEVAPLVVEADNTANPGGWPVGGQTIIDIPNNHLDYALTWYGLALVLLVIYVVYHWRRR